MRIKFYSVTLLLLAVFATLLAFTNTSESVAQALPTETFTPTSTPTITPVPIVVLTSEPATVDNANERILSIGGQGFTLNTTVRLRGYGFLVVTLINQNALTAKLPIGIPLGTYQIEVSDPLGGTALSPQALTVVGPTPTPIIISTLPPPTPVPGQPSLTVQNFTTNPSTATLGGTVTLSFNVLNQGNLPAFGVSVAVDSGSKFFPANGQASVALPDMLPNNAYSGSLSVTVANDAPSGANLVPITFTYRDADGRILNSKATLTVNVDTTAQAPQVTLLTYSTNPDIVTVGEMVIVTAQIQNTGSKTANQVLLRITSDSRVLIAGPRGDSFPIGDIEPNQSKIIELPLVVAQDAKEGFQAQSFNINYIQDGKSTDSPGTFSVQVAPVIKTRPLILLESSVINTDRLKPGDQFTLDFTLKNVGTSTALNMLVTFGSVQRNNSNGGNDTTNSDSSSSTTTTASTSFAPLGSGGTQFVGDLGVDGDVSLTQDFIVSASLESGIYALPITASYTRDDGSNATDTFNATVVVIAPPKLQISFDSGLPPFATVGDAIPLAVTITNRSKNPIIINSVGITGEGIDVFDGAETQVGQLKTDENTQISTTISPNTEGTFSVIFNVNYIDDLNKPQTVQYTYSSEASAPPPIPEEPFPEVPIDITPTPEPTTDPNALFSQLLLGFLGLGE
jgi:hypothetical protein